MTNQSKQDNSTDQVTLINWLLLIVFVLALALSVQNKKWMQFCFSYLSYYVIFAVVLFWFGAVFGFFRDWKISFVSYVKGNCRGILFSLLTAMVVFLSVSQGFRVLSDETNLLSVSKSMTFHKTVDNGTEGKWYYGTFWKSAESVTEKRPFLFPFAVSILHNLLGYNPNNAFILNFLVLWGVLFLIYRIVQPHLGDLWSYAAMVLVVSHPLVCLSATSASFELLNLFFVLLSFKSLQCYFKNNSSSALFFLVMNLVMLANVRYESFIFLLVVMGVLFWTGYIKPRIFSESCVWGIIPFFFLSLIWQRMILLGVSDSNLQGGSWVKAFQFSNLGHNVNLFFKYVLDLSGHLGYAGLLSWIGIAAIVYYVFKFSIFYKDYRSKESAVLLLVSIVSLGAVFMLMLLYQGHIADHPMNGRLYIPILAALAVIPVFVFADVFKKAQEMTIAGVLCCVAIFFYYHPVAVEDRLSNQLFVVRDFKFVLDFLQKNAVKNDLLICGRPGQYIVYNYGAISFSTANKKKDEILSQYKNRLFNKIYVIQEIEYKTKAPEKTNVVTSEYQLRTIQEVQGGAGYVLRISEVILPAS